MYLYYNFLYYNFYIIKSIEQPVHFPQPRFRLIGLSTLQKKKKKMLLQLFYIALTH